MATTVPLDSDTEVPEINVLMQEADRISVAARLPWRILGTPLPRFRLTPLLKLVLGLGGVGLVTLVSVLAWGSSMEFPKDVGRDIGLKIDDGVTWMTKEGDWLFDGIKEIILKADGLAKYQMRPRSWHTAWRT